MIEAMSQLPEQVYQLEVAGDGRRAAQRARDLFSWPAVAARHEAAYEAALHRQRSPDSVAAPV